MENLDNIREQNRWKPEPLELTEKPKGLSSGTVVLLLCTAVLFDGLQALLSFFAVGVVISPFISAFAGLTFWFWFSTHEISFIDWRRLSALLGGGIAELIPVVDILPFWVGAVWYIINTTKINGIVSKIT